MKKLPLWAKATLTILIIIILLALLLGKTIYELTHINPLETGEVVTNMYAIRTDTANCFLVKGESGYIMIDTGNNKEQVEKALKELGILPEEIIAILLTHSDSDHTASIPSFLNASLYLPELEVQIIDGMIKRFKGLISLFLENAFIKSINMTVSNHDSLYLTLQDNDELVIDGIPIWCIATPGHTVGSMSYLLNNEYLFVGDAMGLINGKAGLSMSIFNMDEDKQKESIAKLANFDAQYVFTSHHGFSDDLTYVFGDWK